MANVVGRNNNASAHSGSIMTVVIERLKSVEFTDETKKKFEDALVDKEQQKMLQDLAVGYDNILKLENELKKFKPDHVFYNEDKTVARSEWSKGHLDAKDKLTERIQKYDRAFGAALGGDFKDLRDLNNNFKDKGGGDGKGNKDANPEST